MHFGWNSAQLPPTAVPIPPLLSKWPIRKWLEHSYTWLLRCIYVNFYMGRAYVQSSEQNIWISTRVKPHGSSEEILSWLCIFRVIGQFLFHLPFEIGFLLCLPLGLPLCFSAFIFPERWKRLSGLNMPSKWPRSFGRQAGEAAATTPLWPCACWAKNNQNTSAGSRPSQANRLVQLPSLKQLVGGIWFYWAEPHVYTQWLSSVCSSWK